MIEASTTRALRSDGMRAKPPKIRIDNKRRDCHRNVKGSEQEARHLQPVILAVNVQDRDDDQIGEDEGDHPAEADAAVPQHRRERNVADGTDERDDRDQRADDRSPQRSLCTVTAIK